MVDDKLPLLLDREISSIEKDAFGHRDFSKAIASLIESDSHNPPYSIGLLGKWGSGKSSIKEIYLSELADDQTVTKNLKRSDRILPITFNAWRYGGEDIKRALLRNVYLAIGGDTDSLNDALFRKIEETVKKPLSIKQLFLEACDNWIWSLLQIFIVLVGIIGTLFFISKIFDIDNDYMVTVVILAVSWFGSQSLKYLLSPKRFMIPRYSNFVRVDEPRTSSEEYEDLLIQQLHDFKSSDGKSFERLVVFVDDLDRLSADEMVSGLDAVRTFLEIPIGQLPESLGIVFVISCDEDRVAKALADRSLKSHGLDLPATVIDKGSARRYLDRIFQFRLEIPEFPKLDMRNYAMERLESELEYIKDDLTEAGVSIETVIDRLIYVGVRSPRNAVQILNAFSHSWWTAKRREKEGAGTNRPGGLQEGAITNHPISLAALCTLRVNYPDFYNDLIRDPELIRKFLDVFHRNHKIEEQPKSTQILLKNYLNGNELLPQHYGLRQYLVNIEHIRWPPTLQPLLLLAQDPVARRLGDRALPIYESFISGDHNGLLHLLGRDKDNRKLTMDDTRLLRSMVEDLDRETEVRRDNASACIAAIADRLPIEQAHHLVSPLARQLYESEELRYRLGVENIRRVLPQATKEDRQDVASRLTNDFFKAEGDINFLKKTLQPPSLDEATEMVVSACELVLWVRSNDGLKRNDDIKLLEWFIHRRVSVKNEEYLISFNIFESWMEEHESHLLKDINSDYTELAIEELKNECLDGIDKDSLLRRCRIVFDLLWDEGEESRQILWKQLTGLVSVSDPDGSKLAWTVFEKHANNPKPETLSIFLLALIERLKKECVDEDRQDVDWKTGSYTLTMLTNQRLIDLGKDVLVGISDLAELYSKDDDRSEQACRFIELLETKNSDQLDSVMSNWIERIFTDLPSKCKEWISVHYNSALSEQNQIQFIKQLNSVVNNANITKEKGSLYVNLMSQLNCEALKNDNLKEHLVNLSQQIQTKHNNPNNYLYHVFPAVPLLIKYIPPNNLGTMLEELFNQTKNNPKLFGWLHEQMAQHWPINDELLSPYNAKQIFDDAISVANSHPQTKNITGVLFSTLSMANRNIAGDKEKSKVANLACMLWQHYPNESVDALKMIEVIPDTNIIADLPNSVAFEDEEERKSLEEVWSIFTPQLSSAVLTQVANILVANPMKGYDKEPDFSLYLWLQLCGDSRKNVLQSLIKNDNLNDEQLSRIWTNTFVFSNDLDSDFFTNTLLFGLTTNDKTNTIKIIFDYQNLINSLFSNKEERYRLGKILIESLVKSNSQNVRNQLAQWIKEIEAEPVLKILGNMDNITDDDKEVLKSHFPKSKYFKFEFSKKN